MDKYIIKNDKGKLIFLPGYKILWKYEEKIEKLLLSEETYFLLLNMYKTGEIVEIENNVSLKYVPLIEKEIIKLVDDDFLVSKGTKYEKNNFYFYTMFGENNVFQKLRQKHILIVGAGAIGTELMNHLIAAGIKRITVIDFDKVNLSNLNRQYAYNMEDINLFKVDAIKSYLLKKEPNAEINTCNLKICDCSQLENIADKSIAIDLIVCAADTPAVKIKEIVAKTSLNLNIPVFFCGVGLIDGAVGPLLVSKETKRQHIEKWSKFINSGAHTYPLSSSFGATNSIISGYAALEIIFYLAEKYNNVKSLEKTYKICF